MAGGVRLPPCSWAPVVDHHFAGRIQPDDEVALRSHLPGCPSCTQRYERQLLLADLTRQTGLGVLGTGTLGREDRLAIGLGLPPRRGPVSATRHWPVLGVALALGALALFVNRSDGPSRQAEETFQKPAPVSASAPPVPDAGSGDAGVDAGKSLPERTFTPVR